MNIMEYNKNLITVDFKNALLKYIKEKGIVINNRSFAISILEDIKKHIGIPSIMSLDGLVKFFYTDIETCINNDPTIGGPKKILRFTISDDSFKYSNYEKYLHLYCRFYWSAKLRFGFEFTVNRIGDTNEKNKANNQSIKYARGKI